jgi:hypothetical protein
LEERIEALEREAAILRKMLLRTLDVAVSLAGAASAADTETSKERSARASDGITEVWNFVETPIGGTND